MYIRNLELLWNMKQDIYRCNNLTYVRIAQDYLLLLVSYITYLYPITIFVYKKKLHANYN